LREYAINEFYATAELVQSSKLRILAEIRTLKVRFGDKYDDDTKKILDEIEARVELIPDIPEEDIR